ncbi:IQ motif-containing protein H [Leuresthes tenuis]|uniref:IQ motif-containing protein H n=1 Tax=Leuresthes tenuis TaxID=355514 RepID=UPI003B50EA0C
MSERLRKKDNLGAVLVQVQDDRRQLKCSLEKITVSESGTALDIQALDNAIRIENDIRKHAEDYVKTINKQQLVPPSIEDFPKQSIRIPKWKPSLESVPDVQAQWEELPGASHGEKHPISTHVTCNPAHQNNRASVHVYKCGPSLPDVTRTNTNAAHHRREVAGFVEGLQVSEPKGLHFPSMTEGDVGTVAQPGMLCLSVQHKAAALHPREDLHTFKKGSNSRCLKQPKWQTDSESVCVRKDDECTPPWTTKTPPPSTTSKSMDQSDMMQGSSSLIHKSPQGEIDPLANLISCPGQRYKGEGGIDAAAIRIQACWRRYVARAAYLCHYRRKWAAGIIAISWLMHAQMCRVRKNLQARRFRQLENSRSRAQHMAANWKHIQSSKRTIIHIPSLGYSQTQRLNLRRLSILQNIQMSRLCDIRDENVEVIYICSQHLGDDILLYYTSLLKCDGATDGADTRTSQALSCRRRFIILTPEAVDYFPAHNMCLSTLLKYSPRTLKRIRNLIQGKWAYIVGGVAHMDDLAVADELDVPILGPEPAVFQIYNTKSEGRKIFAQAETDVPLGQGDVYSLYQLYETLAELMTQNITVQRWFLKTDSEHGGRGTAYCDVCHLSSYNWALQQYHRYGPDLWNSKWIQEPVLLRYLDEIPEWLAHYAQPAKTSCYPSWACFLKTFLRQGGVVEATPPSESVTYLTVDMLLEPGGEVTMLSCGDQLHGSCHLEVIGSTVPQTSIHPETLHSICMRVGQACLQRFIIGYVSVGFATFVDPSSMEQKVWAVDLNIAYSDQLAMTQMLLMVTGGTLNWRTGCLEMPIREKGCEHQITSKPPVVNCYAVIGTHLYHSNLSMLYHNVFFKMCNMNGIGFNKKRKQGTVFALYDSSERCTIGMITVSEDLPGALVTFAQNLSVIHQEISSPKTQGETNFKELIKNIKDVLKMTGQNKKLLKEKPAA